MANFKPMLAKDAPEDLSVLSYPLIVQPKLDGIRYTIVVKRDLRGFRKWRSPICGMMYT